MREQGKTVETPCRLHGESAVRLLWIVDFQAIDNPDRRSDLFRIY